MATNPFKTVSLTIILVFTVFSANLLSRETRTYTIVIDPGHGGAPSIRKVDKWDRVTNRFLSRYLYGGIYKNHHEHNLVLPLAKSVVHYLELTNSKKGWIEFQKILSVFSNAKKFKHLRFNTHITRNHSYNHFHFAKKDPRNHEPYLLYDYPDNLHSGRMKPGRISRINQWQPHLVVALHTTPAAPGKPGGMGAVLAPGFRTFNLIRQISLKKRALSQFNKSLWADKWLVTDPGWTRFDAAKSDAWVYFHGFKTKKSRHLEIWEQKNRGIRYNMVQWRYADPPGWEKLARLNQSGPYSKKHCKFIANGRFWDREKGQPEAWRREIGYLKFGGDNHFATDQLMRFVQFGVRLQVEQLRTKNAIGPIVNPWVSTFSLPTFTNAIVAYLEIAHTNRWKDRRLIVQYKEQTAKSLAAGIYALFESLDLKKNSAPYQPDSRIIDFNKYENWKYGNYFKIVK